MHVKYLQGQIKCYEKCSENPTSSYISSAIDMNKVPDLIFFFLEENIGMGVFLPYIRNLSTYIPFFWICYLSVI